MDFKADILNINYVIILYLYTFINYFDAFIKKALHQ
jgi:hypothetical protein